MKNTRRIIAIILICSLTMGMTANAKYVLSTDEISIEKGVQTVYVSEDEEGIYEVTSLLKEDGIYTIRGYKDKVLVEEYIVVPGSGSYVKRTFCNGIIEHETILFEETTPLNSISVNNTNRAGYLGTMYYNNVYLGLNYMISCTIENSTDVNSSWEVQSFAGTAAEWVVKLVSMLGISVSIATACVESFLISSAFIIIAGAIHNRSAMRLKATVISHTITGTSTDPMDSSYHEGTLFGETATITAPGSEYEGCTYKDGYSSEDWGNNAFGRAMFKEVYNSDWTPTGWTD